MEKQKKWIKHISMLFICALAMCLFVGIATPQKAHAAVNIGKYSGNNPCFLSVANNVTRTFYAYLKQGESLNITVKTNAASFSGSGNLCLTVYNPSGVKLGTGAYTASKVMTTSANTLSYSTPAVPAAGTYRFEFTSQTPSPILSGNANQRLDYNFSVKNASGVDQPGRIWTDRLTLYQTVGSSYYNQWFNATLYTVSDSGYRYQINLDHYNGIGSYLMFTARGLVNSSGVPIDKSLRAVITPTGSSDTQIPAGYSFPTNGIYHIFFEPISADIPTSVIPAVPFDNDGIIGKITGFKPDAVTAWPGAISYWLKPGFVGNYSIQLDTNGNGSFTDAVDVNIPLVATGGSANGSAANPLTWRWDGKNGQGATVTSAAISNIKARINVPDASRLYVTLADVELFGGLTVKQLNGAAAGNTTVYWNDTDIRGSYTGKLPATCQPLSNTAGVKSDVTGRVHGWTDATPSISFQMDWSKCWGDKNFVQTWSKSGVSATAIANTQGDLDLPPVLAIQKTVDKATAKPGETLTWTVKVTNTGGGNATNVKIKDSLPTGINYANVTGVTTSAGTVSGSGSQFTWTIPTLAKNGGSQTVTMSAKVPASAKAGDKLINTAEVTEFNGAPPATSIKADATTTVITPNLGITKTVDKATAKPGEALTWTVRVTNSGTADATSVKVSDALPAGISYADLTGLSPSTGSVGGSGNTFTWTIPTLAKGGGSQTLTMSAKVPAGAKAGDKVINTAQVAEYDGQPPATPLKADATTTVITPSLGITKNVDKATAKPGETLTWTVKVSNSGTADAANVKVSDALPEGISYADVTVNTPLAGTVIGSGNTFTWTIPTLAKGGGSQTLTMSAKVPAGAEAGNKLINAVEVTEYDGQSPTDPIKDDATTTVITPALSIQKDVDRATARPGDTLTWTVRVTNSGTADAASVKVSDLLPEGISYDDVTFGTPSEGTVSQSGNDFIWTIQTLAKGGDSQTLTMSAKIPADAQAGAELINSVKVAEYDGRPPETPIEDDTDTTVITSNLSIIKDVDKATAKPGETLTWTVKITNDGADDATNVIVKDTLPEGISCDDVTFGQPSEGTVSQSGNDFTWTVTTLAGDGGSETLTMSAKVPANAKAGERVVNTATITEYDGQEPDPAITDNAATTVITPALAIIKTVDKAAAKPGEALTWTVKVTNNGTADAAGVIVNDTLPEGISCDDVTFGQPSEGTVSQSGTDFTWTILTVAKGGGSETLTISAKVPAGAKAENTVVNTVKIPEYDGEPQEDPIEAEATTTVITPDLAITKVVDKTTAKPDTTLTWTVKVTNNGTADAADVKVKDTLPEGITWADVTGITPAAGTTVAGSGDHIWTIPTLARGGGSETLTMSAKVPADAKAGGELINSVKVAEYDGQPPEDPIEDDATTTVATADLTITKSVDNAIAKPGEVITWTVIAINHGDADTANVKVKDDLPDGISWDDVTLVTASADVLGSGNDFVWTIPTLTRDGGIATLTISAKVPVTAKTGDHVVNSVKVTEYDGEQPENPIADDADTAVVTPELSIKKNVDRMTAKPGATLTWTVKVTNDGAADADNVIVNDRLPVGIDYNDVTIENPSTGDVTGSGNQFTWTIPTVSKEGGTETLAMSAKIPANAQSGDKLTNSVEVAEYDGLQPVDPIRDEATTAVITTAVSIQKDVNKADAKPGETLTWTVKVTNDGTAGADDVIVSDHLPGGIKFKDVTVEKPSAGTISGSGNKFTWAIPTVAKEGGYETAVMSAKVPGSVKSGAELINVAEVAKYDGEEPKTPIKDDAETDVQYKEGLALTKAVNKANVVPGGNLTYTINAKNTGTVALQNVKVKDPLPDYMYFVSSKDGKFVPRGNFGYVTWNIKSLAPGKTVKLRFVAKVNIGCPIHYTINNMAVATDIENGKPVAHYSNKVKTAVPTAGQNPQTGDQFNRALYGAAALAAALLAAAVIIPAMRKRRGNR